MPSKEQGQIFPSHTPKENWLIPTKSHQLSIGPQVGMDLGIPSHLVWTDLTLHRSRAGNHSGCEVMSEVSCQLPKTPFPPCAFLPSLWLLQPRWLLWRGPWVLGKGVTQMPHLWLIAPQVLWPAVSFCIAYSRLRSGVARVYSSTELCKEICTLRNGRILLPVLGLIFVIVFFFKKKSIHII